MKSKGVLMALVTAAAFLLCSCGPSRPDFKADYDVIIIGGGLGGLSAAAHCASGGMKVLLFEQHDKVGGCATNFTRGPFMFEVALHEMDGAAEGGAVYNLMKAAGVYDKVKLIPHRNLYRSIVPGADVTVPTGWDSYTAALKKSFPGHEKEIDRYRGLCLELQEQAMTMAESFRWSPLKRVIKIAMVPIRQRTLFKWRNRTVKDLMDECFTDERLKAVVSQLWCYLGPPADRQSAIMFVMAMGSYIQYGAWHVMGSSQALSDAYAERIKELGGEVRTGVLVKKIIVKDGMVRGVETDEDKSYSARYIVANTDPWQLSLKLVGRENLPESYISSINKLKTANSLFGVWLGLNIDLKKRGYRDFEMFYNTSLSSGKDYDSMMAGDYANGTAVIAIFTNLGDPSYAPPGKSVVKLDAYADMKSWPERGDEYYRLKKKKMDELISLASKVIPELKNPAYVEVKEGYTPRTLRDFTLNRGGVVYGFQNIPEQYSRIPVKTPIDNLFIASNWTQVSHGFSGVQINGWMASRLILDIEGKP